MRRLLLLFTALALLIGGRSILVTGNAAPNVVLRDGLLVALAGMILFALQSQKAAWLPESGAIAALTGWQRTLFGIGCGVGLLGAGWLALLLRGNGEGSGLLLAFALWIGGILFGCLAIARRGKAKSPSQAAAWSVERALDYLRQKEAEKAQPPASAAGMQPRTVGLLLLGLTLLGLLLRLWNFSGLPAGCIQAECDSALAATSLLTSQEWRVLFSDTYPLNTLLTAGVLGLLGISQQTLSLLGLLLGTAAIPIFYAATRRFVLPGAALLTTLLVVFSPPLLIMSRHPVPALLLLLLTTGYLAVRPVGGQAPSHSRWAASGLLAGLLLWAGPPSLIWPLFVWYLLTPPIRRAFWPVYYLPLLVVSLPHLASNLWQPDTFSFPLLLSQTPALVAQFLVDGGYLPALLALLGGAWLVRHLRQPQGWLWSTGVVVIGLFVFAGPHAAEFATFAPLVVLMAMGSAIAVEQLYNAFSRPWLPLLGSRWVWAVVALCMLIPLTIGTRNQMKVLGTQFVATSSGEETAIGSYLYRHFLDSSEDGGNNATLVLVPAPLLNSPATRLAARGILAQTTHILPLDPVIHLPFTGPPFIEQGLADLLYILPASDPDLHRYVTALYPGMAGAAIQDEEGRTWGVAYPVSRSGVANAQGLSTLYYAGEEIAPQQEAVDVRREGPLAFDWAQAAPLDGPFTLIGQGALYAPGGGIYGLRAQYSGEVTVRLELSTPGPPPGVLDSAAGIDEIVVELPQGFHRFSLTASNRGDGGSLSVQWRQPGGEWQPIPRPALYNGKLALGQGLVASYYAGVEDTDFAGLAAQTPAHLRLEPWVSGGDLAAAASAVVWQGKIAAPMEGSYRFDGEADGPLQLELDGILLLDTPQGKASTATLLLSQGWHNLTLRYRSGGAGTLRLHWQPPGAITPTAIGPDFLAALHPNAAVVDLPLPNLPAPQTGPVLAVGEPMRDGQAGAELQPPAGDGLPGNLPDLPLALVWQVGSCGADIEQFQQPRGVALNPHSGYAYIADAGNRRVILRDLGDGSLVDYLESDLFEEPFDLDVDLLGNVFVLDALSQTIYRLEDPAGTPVALPSGTAFYRPRGLGMDLNGNFYVADTGGARVVKLTGTNGAVEFQEGGADSLLGQGQPVDVLLLPTGAFFAVTAQDGTLWRLDTGESWLAAAPASTIDGPHLAGLTTSAFFLSDPERRLITYFNGAGQPLGQLRSELFAKPVGVGALVLGGDVLLAVSDSAVCQVTLWRGPLDAMP